MQERLEVTEDDTHPIDCVEEVLNDHNWSFDRPSNDELIVDVSGQNSKYRIYFIWQENMNALQFCCNYQLSVSEQNLSEAQAAILSINENLWLGHFDIPTETRSPTFRYTCLFRGAGRLNAAETIEDMVDIALIQCERYFPIFQLLTDQALLLDSETMSLALMETAGES